MTQKSDARRSMADYSVATHAGGRTVEDARMDGYHERVGRLRRERAVWPGAAFIVEALLLLVFLAGSLAVLMDLNADAKQLGDESDKLLSAITVASNCAEEFAADPVGYQAAYEADPLADGWLYPSRDAIVSGEDVINVECVFSQEQMASGTMYHATFSVRKVQALTDPEEKAAQGIQTADPHGIALLAWEEGPIYTLETQRYVPARAAGAEAAADNTKLPIVLGPDDAVVSDDATPLDSGEGHYPEEGEHLLLPRTGAAPLPLGEREVA